MDVTSMSIYWITRLDNVIFILCIFSVMSLLSALGATVIYSESNHEDKDAYRCFILSALVFIACTIGAAFTPSTKTMAAILVVPKIANSDTAKEIGNDIVGLAKEWIVELKPKKEGKEK